MTLVEFLHPIKTKSHRDKCLAILYYRLRYEEMESLTAQQIQQALIQTRMPNAKGVNVPDVLAKSGALVDSPGSNGSARLWRLTDVGKNHIRDLMGLPETDPEVEHDVGELNALLAKLKDSIVKGTTLVNTELQKHDSKARIIKKIEDFQYIREETLLLVAEGVGVLDKTTRGILHTNLQTRNGCGHPNKYNPGIAKAKSFIEDVTGIVFP